LPGEPLKAYLFADASRAIGVLWAPAGLPPRTIRLASPKLRLWDLMGRPMESATFVPGESPVYIIGDGVSAEEFEKAVAAEKGK
jgi:hypothetical protein